MHSDDLLLSSAVGSDTLISSSATILSSSWFNNSNWLYHTHFAVWYERVPAPI